LGGDECLGGGDLDVGSDADDGPIVGAVGVDGPAFGDADAEVIVEAMENAGMRRAASRFTNEGGAFEHFEVIGEVFGGRRGDVRGEDIDRLVGEVVSGNGRAGPGTLRGVFARAVHVFGMIEEIGGEEHDHGGIAAAVVAEIEEDGVGVVELAQGGFGGGFADGRIWERVEFEVADVVGEESDFFEGAVVALKEIAITKGRFGSQRGRRFGKRFGAVNEVEVQVVADVAHLTGHESGKGGTVGSGVIIAASFVGVESVGHLPSEAAVDVVLREVGGSGVDDTMTIGGRELSFRSGDADRRGGGWGVLSGVRR
jgi:hypothetical protein